MNERDNIYLQILKYGLISLRNATLRGDIEYCKAEAEHLHNLPTLIGESNEARHEYYFDGERVSYLEKVKPSSPDMRFILGRYSELWPQLADCNRRYGGADC
jgi:hypothetical protein